MVLNNTLAVTSHSAQVGLELDKVWDSGLMNTVDFKLGESQSSALLGNHKTSSKTQLTSVLTAAVPEPKTHA